MRKLVTALVTAAALLLPGFVSAQTVASQSTLITTPYGGPGFIVSTTTANGGKLQATSTPYFSNFFFGNATGTNMFLNGLTVSGQSGCASFTAGVLTGTGSACGSGSGGAGFGKTWELLNGALAPTTTVGVIVSASSTIGNGTLGLTTSGTATTTGNAYFGSNVGIGVQNPAYALDFLGKIREANVVTDATNKSFFFLDRNFTNAQNDFLLMFGQSKTSANTLIIGGGQTGFTAASTIALFTGAGNNTDIGTSRLSIDATGNVTISSLGSGIVKSASGVLSNATAGSDYVNGSGTSGNCVQWGASNALADAGSACGSGSATPGGASSTIQYNANSVFAGNSGLTYTGSVLNLVKKLIIGPSPSGPSFTADTGLVIQADNSNGQILTMNAAGTEGVTIDNSGTYPTIHSDYYSGSDPTLHISTYTDKNNGNALFIIPGGQTGIGTTSPWKLLSVGTGNTGTFAISTSTAGCAQFSPLGELYSTGSTCGTGGGGSGIGDPFTHVSVWGQTTSATSTQLSLTGSPNSLVASGTIQAANINIDQYSSYKQEGNSILYASSTNSSVAVGIGAGTLIYTQVGDTHNTAVGYQAYNTSSTGSNQTDNTAVGYQALQNNQGGKETAVGSGALATFATNGNSQGDVAVGYQAANALNVANGRSVAVGYQALLIASNAQRNTAIGAVAGSAITSGANNTLIGFNTGASISSGAANIVIGNNVDVANVNSQLNIGNVLYGTGIYNSTVTNSATPTTNGSIGISTSTPHGKLSIMSNSSDTNTSLFEIGSSTSGVFSTLFMVSNAGTIFTTLANGCVQAASGFLTSTGVSCGSGGSTGSTIATTSDIAISQVAYITKTSGQTTLGSVATGTISAGSSALTVTAGRAALGGALAIDCTPASGSQNGCLSSTDWSTFNGKQAAGTYLTALGNYSTTTAAAVSFSTTTLTTNGQTFGIQIVPSAAGILFTPTVTGTYSGQAGSVANALTINNGGAGDASGATYNGSAAKTISYNSIGAVPTTRNINTTFPVQGGGDLSADRTITSAFGTTTNTGLPIDAFVYTGHTGILLTAASSSLNLPNTALANSSVTINTNNGITGGGSVALGASLSSIGLASMSAGVLGIPVAGVPTSQATSTLYGNGTGGQLLTWNNGLPQWIASTTYADGTGISHTFVAGQLTITNTGVTSLGNGTGTTCSGTAPGSCSLASISAGVLGSAVTGIPTSQATSTLYGAVQNGKILAGLGGTLQYVATSTDSCSTGVTCTYSGGANSFSIANGAITNVMLATTYVQTLTVNTAQGVSGSFSAGATPALSLTLGALTGVTSFNGLIVTANTGVITTGTWNGTTIDTAHGGTNHGNYTAGSVAFAGAGGTLLTENNANFFWDNTRVAHGIGTTTPNDIFTVASSTAPQISLSDALGSNLWTLRNINGNFFVATSSFAATSTNALLSIVASPTANATTTFSLTDWVLKQTSQVAFSIMDAFGTSILNINTASTTGSIFTVAATTSPNLAQSAIKLFDVDQYGHLTASSTGPAAPTVSCTPSGGTLGANSNDVTGDFTTGTLSTACTLTFARAYAVTPEVMVGGGLTSGLTRSTTAVTFTLSAAVTGDDISYFIIQP